MDTLNVVRFTIIGEACSLKNSREIVRPFGMDRPLMIKSKKARDYERDMRRQIPATAKVMFAGPVRFTATIYYANERSDLDESIILDCLQPHYVRLNDKRELVDKGVIINDRQVKEKHVYWRIDKKNPRADIEVVALVPQALELALNEVYS